MGDYPIDLPVMAECVVAQRKVLEISEMQSSRIKAWSPAPIPTDV